MTAKKRRPLLTIAVVAIVLGAVALTAWVISRVTALQVTSCTWTAMPLQLPDDLRDEPGPWSEWLARRVTEERLRAVLERAFPEAEWAPFTGEGAPAPRGFGTRVRVGQFGCSYYDLWERKTKVSHAPPASIAAEVSARNAEVQVAIDAELESVYEELRVLLREFNERRETCQELCDQVQAKVGCGIKLPDPYREPALVLEEYRQAQEMLNALAELPASMWQERRPRRIQLRKAWGVDLENGSADLNLSRPAELAERLASRPTWTERNATRAARKRLALSQQGEVGVRVEVSQLDMPSVTVADIERVYAAIRSPQVAALNLHLVFLGAQNRTTVSSYGLWWRTHTISLAAANTVEEHVRFLVGASLGRCSGRTRVIRNLQRDLARVELALGVPVVASRQDEPDALAGVAKRLASAAPAMDPSLGEHLTEITVRATGLHILGKCGFRELSVAELNSDTKTVLQLFQEMHQYAGDTTKLFLEALRLQASLQSLLGDELVVRPRGAEVDAEVQGLLTIERAFALLVEPMSRADAVGAGDLATEQRQLAARLTRGPRALRRITVTDKEGRWWYGVRDGELRVPYDISISDLYRLLERCAHQDLVVRGAREAGEG